jgi:hypothetical protein
MSIKMIKAGQTETIVPKGKRCKPNENTMEKKSPKTIKTKEEDE